MRRSSRGRRSSRLRGRDERSLSRSVKPHLGRGERAGVTLPPITGTVQVELVSRHPATVSDVARFKRAAGVLRAWTRAVDLQVGPLAVRVADLINDFRARRVTMPREERDELSSWVRDWLHAEAGRGRAAPASVVEMRVTRLVRGAIVPGAGHRGEATQELLSFVSKLLAHRPANRFAKRPMEPIVLDASRRAMGAVWAPVAIRALLLDETIEGVKAGVIWTSWAS